MHAAIGESCNTSNHSEACCYTGKVSPGVFPVTFDELGEAFAGAAVVQREAGLALLLHTETWRLDLGEGEAEVLVQVVQLVDEVTDISA